MMEEKAAILARQKIDFQPPDAITHVVSANNTLVLAFANGTLQRKTKSDPEDEIEITKNPTEKILFVHLDPSGQHLLLSTSSGEVHYLHRSMRKPRVLSRMKGHIITAVGWNIEACRESGTGFTLFGTSKGQIFEADIAAPPDDKGNRTANVLYWKLWHTFTEGAHSSVTGLQLHRCAVENRWFVLASMPGQLCPFFCTASSDAPALHLETPGRVHSFPISESAVQTRSQLRVYPGCGADPPSHYAWMVDSGVKFGQLDSSQNDPFKILTGDRFYTFSSTDAQPLSMCLTEFHFLLLYADRLLLVCTLNEQTVFEDVLGTKFGRVRGMTRDAISGLVWVFTEHQVLRYKFVDELRYVWRIFLQRGDFSNARLYCGQNVNHLDVVLKSQASQLFDDKKFKQAAEIFAMSRAPFEEVALKFIEAGERSALKLYLSRRFDAFTPNEKTQAVMIVLWLIELQLTELGEAKSGLASHSQLLHLRAFVDAPTVFAPPPTVQKHAKEIQGFDHNRFKALRDEFRDFLRKESVFTCIQTNAEAVCKIMIAHGDMDSLQYFAELMKDFERVVSLLIQQERFDDALKMVVKTDDPRLFYKFSPNLMPHIAKKLVDAFIAQAHALKPKRLLPALFHSHVDPKQAAEALRYLEFCVSTLQSNDRAVHNYLVALYAKVAPEKLLPYLLQQGKDPTRVCFDLKYALRMCAEHGLQRACVHIYATMGLHEEAVELALKVDVDLAKQCAQPTDDDEELKKKLWLHIAKHVVEKEKDIKKCMQLLKESNDLIKIQEILPFFPDFVTIDHFKEPLCQCLSEHSSRIKQLQEDMQDATEAAQQIKEQLVAHKRKYTLIRVTEKCSSCSHPLLARSFYAFPCRHNFHVDCLENEVFPLLAEKQQNRVRELRRQLSVAASASAPEVDTLSTASGGAAGPASSLRDELDELLAAECAFCGELSVSQVDKPFFVPADYVQQLKSWE